MVSVVNDDHKSITLGTTCTTSDDRLYPNDDFEYSLFGVLYQGNGLGVPATSYSGFE